MIEFLAETVLLSFTMGGLTGAIIALKLKGSQKADAKATENVLEVHPNK